MSDLITKNNLSLCTPVEVLEQQLLLEEDPDALQNIIDLFNLNIRKKDLIRTSKLNSLQDKAVAQIAQRLEKKADAFSNKDLLDYFKVIQDTINRTSKENESLPPLQINQQQINIGENQLSRESRIRVADAIQEILNGTTNPYYSETIVELDEEEE